MKITPLFAAALLLPVFQPFSAISEEIDVGADAPAVTSVDENGEAVDLGAELKEGLTLVYFYPKADTPGCTKQACNLRDEFTAVKEAGIKVFGVSADTPEDQLAFKKKYDLPFTLIADKEGKVIAAFGVPTRGAGFASRHSFLFKDGKLIWRDTKAKPQSQAQDAIAAAKAG